MSNIPHSVRLALSSLTIFALLFSSGSSVFAFENDIAPSVISEESGEYVPGEIIVKYKEDAIDLETSSGQLAETQFAEEQSLEKKTELDQEQNISVLAITDSSTVEEKVALLQTSDDVEYAEPNYVRYPATINTNDTDRGLLWGLDNTGQIIPNIPSSGTPDADIDMPEAWAISDLATATPIIVAIIDDGVFYTHPDLAASMWDGTNCKSETGAVLGGCLHGYDFEQHDKDPLPSSGSSHGTHIAGTIAAVRNNNLGVVGVAPNAKIMAIRFGLNVSTEVKAIDFAIQNGAKVINASFTGGTFSQTEYDAINRFRAAGGIFVAAAGNTATNNDDTATSGHYYPSDYDLDNIISVAATDQNDNLAYFSNYGTNSVDVGAPGVNIRSTIPPDQYEYYSGTSMATPHVVGLAALIWGIKPAFTYTQVRDTILQTGDTLPALSAMVATGKRINAGNAMLSLFPPPDTTSPLITLLGSSTTYVMKGSSYVDMGATAVDNVDGNITAHIVASSSVNTAVLGVYAVTYDVADAAGNHALEVTRLVRVIPNTYSQTIILAPGWNIISTPRILESHTFSAPETLSNFAIYTLDPAHASGWATMAELGQSEFTPLYGYFINNKTATSQVLTLNYKANTAPNERLFTRNFTSAGWYSFGVANPSYAQIQGPDTTDTNNPDRILSSLLGATSNYDSVVDLTNATFPGEPNAVRLVDPWKYVVRSPDVANNTEINTLNDFRETKGYAIYIKVPSTLGGFQQGTVPQCSDGIDNDTDGLFDYPSETGCVAPTDDSELPVFVPGSIALGKYSAYANQTVTVPQTAYKIGEYRLTTGSGEGVNLDTLTLGLGGLVSPGTLANIYIVYGSKTTTVKAVGSSTLIYSIAEPLASNSTMNIAVYATLPSTLGSGDTVQTNLTVGGQSQGSLQVVSSGAVLGQTISIAVGALVAQVDASTPVSTIVVGNTMPKVASFKFISSNDTFTVDELTAKVASVKDAGAIIELVFKDGATELKHQPLIGMYATATGLSIAVPNNGTKVVDVYANLGSIGTGAASTSAKVGITLGSYEAMNSNGTKIRTYVNLVGNSMYAYKTKPTITNVALPTTVLNAGTQTVYQFTLVADAGGTVAWRKIKFNIATSSGAFTVNTFNLYDAANQSTALANTTCTLLATTVTCASTADQEVSGSKTYVMKALISGSLVSGASVSTNIANSGLGFVPATDSFNAAATAATFVWSDESSLPHTAITADWNNDYLVKNLPTDSQTLTK